MTIRLVTNHIVLPPLYFHPHCCGWWKLEWWTWCIYIEFDLTPPNGLKVRQRVSARAPLAIAGYLYPGPLAGTYWLNMMISGFFPLKIWWLWHAFLSQNIYPLYEWHWIFFLSPSGENLPNRGKKEKRKTLLHAKYLFSQSLQYPIIHWKLGKYPLYA